MRNCYTGGDWTPSRIYEKEERTGRTRTRDQKQKARNMWKEYSGMF